MSEKVVISLEDFNSSDNKVVFPKDAFIKIVQEDPSGYYYYGLNFKNEGGWFLKTKVREYVEPGNMKTSASKELIKKKVEELSRQTGSILPRINEKRKSKKENELIPNVSWTNMDALANLMPKGQGNTILDIKIDDTHSNMQSSTILADLQSLPVPETRKRSNSYAASPVSRNITSRIEPVKNRIRSNTAGRKLERMEVSDIPSPIILSKAKRTRSGDDLLGPTVRNAVILFGESYSKSSKNPLDEYASKNFPSDFEKSFIYQRASLKRPMHKISDITARNQALSAFEYILIYCGDAGGNRFESARNVVDSSKNGLLTDEIICQLVKQTINNVSTVQDSDVRAWALLCMVLVYSEPSIALKESLVDHMKIVSNYAEPFDHLATKCLEHIHLSSADVHKRKMLPSDIEIHAFETYRYSIRFKLGFPNDVTKSFNVSPYTVGSDLLEQAAKYLTLPDYLDHGIAVIINDLEVLPLLPEDKVLDVVAIAEKLLKEDDETKKLGVYEIFDLARFQVIRKLWVRVDPLLFNEMDEWELTQIYNEIRPNFISGAWFGQTQLQNDYLDVVSLLSASRAILEGKGEATYEVYVPKLILDRYDIYKEKKNRNMISQKFVKSTEDLHHSKPFQIRLAFIKNIHEWELFGSRVFNVYFEDDNKMAGDSFLAVRPNDVWFLDLQRKPISSVKYSEIQKIILEHGARVVVIKTGTVAQQRIIRFQTKQGFAIQAA